MRPSKTQKAEIVQLDRARLEQVGDAVYADGKWTIRDIFQHLIDAEHVLSYRSLRIGRNDPTPLPGFDQDLFAENVSTRGRRLETLVDELKQLRIATSLLFRSFDREALQRSANVNGNQMSVLAYGFAILGHQKYHLRIIQERYLPLIGLG